MGCYWLNPAHIRFQFPGFARLFIECYSFLTCQHFLQCLGNIKMDFKSSLEILCKDPKSLTLILKKVERALHASAPPSYFYPCAELHEHKSPELRAALLLLPHPSLRKASRLPPAAPKEPPTSPAVTAMSPETMRIVVLFPAPLGPNRPNTSPGTNVQETLMVLIVIKTLSSACKAIPENTV